MRTFLISLLLLTVPATAHAQPTISTLKSCYVSVRVDPQEDRYETEDVTFTAAGFTPGAKVDVLLDGNMAQEGVTVDSAGNLPKRTVKAPFVDTGSQSPQRQFTITLIEQGNAANTASATALVSALEVQARPRSATPSTRITFTGRGFTALNRPVYAHYVRKGKSRKTVRLGMPQGPCGTFSVKRRQFPFRPSAGLWILRVDQEKRYRPSPSSAFVDLEIRVRRVIKTRG